MRQSCWFCQTWWMLASLREQLTTGINSGETSSTCIIKALSQRHQAHHQTSSKPLKRKYISANCNTRASREEIGQQPSILLEVEARAHGILKPATHGLYQRAQSDRLPQVSRRRVLEVFLPGIASPMQPKDWPAAATSTAHIGGAIPQYVLEVLQ
jgi:hypothetical protein